MLPEEALKPPPCKSCGCHKTQGSSDTPSPQTTACWGCSVHTRLQPSPPHIWKEENSSSSYCKGRCRTAAGLVQGCFQPHEQGRSHWLVLMVRLQRGSSPLANKSPHSHIINPRLSPCYREPERDAKPLKRRSSCFSFPQLSRSCR